MCMWFRDILASANRWSGLSEADHRGYNSQRRRVWIEGARSKFGSGCQRKETATPPSATANPWQPRRPEPLMKESQKTQTGADRAGCS
ncbi:hypothetical protein PGTUg99_003856 [Puccinia graminis f. sp. tritici]|uniref:Uncharacterized protein n=1 Tax=Puccinia graminis f. sp. tritici TaxID=56615 RepID=A0A5B0SD68_PUCGR|nr:hypothetical protein PGTUg99_003856 [Puccinia graminis f. sp. tritici]